MKTVERLISAVGLAALSVFALPAAGFASTVLVDKGSYTYDSASGLDWLDVSATAGFSYNQVEQNDGVSYIADGWHYATAADLKSLSADIGLPFPDGFSDVGSLVPEQVASVSTVGDLFGWTKTDSAYDLLVGVYGPAVDGLAGAFNFAVYNPGTPNAQASVDDSPSVIWMDNTTIIIDGADRPMGSFLVRDADVAATPLPGASLLFASGLGLIGFAAWRRKRGDASPSTSPAICA